MRRRGFTLVELLVFSTLALFVLGVGWSLLQSGTVIGSTTHEGLNLQQGVRNFMENLVKDVNAAAVIAEPHGLTPMPATRIVLWVYADEQDDPAGGGMVEPGRRLLINGGPDGAGLVGGINPYPFNHSEQDTNWGLLVEQITYEWDAASGKVTREAVPGAMVAAAGRGQPFIQSYSFQPAPGGSPSGKRQLSENVTEFEVYPFGYDETAIDDVTQMGTLRPTGELPDFVSGLAVGQGSGPVVAGFTGATSTTGFGAATGTTERQARTAMLLVKVKAVFDYQNARYRDPEFQMATKIWSYTKLYEHRYFPYFSSVDDDLRF